MTAALARQVEPLVRYDSRVGGGALLVVAPPRRSERAEDAGTGTTMRGGACDDGGVAGGGELVVRGDAAQRDDVEHLLAALRLLQAARGPDAHKQRDGEVVRSSSYSCVCNG